MFGYIVIHKDELKVKDYNMLRSMVKSVTNIQIMRRQ